MVKHIGTSIPWTTTLQWKGTAIDTVDTGSNLGKSHGYHAEWKKKKPVTKSYMQYDSIYIAALKRQNDRNEEQSSSCQRLGTGVGLEGWVNVSIRG